MAGTPISRVQHIRTSDLHPNPHNPRLLFDREPLTTLKNSIQKVGILVPLTVYFDKKARHFVILDGQRRWICARQLGLSNVPANEVPEPSLVQNIVTMFQIHKLRLDWELMPTALKLEVLIRQLKEKNDRALAQLTGLDIAVVQRCKKLLSYPKNYQDMMLAENPEQRIKADFFIELYPVITDRSLRSQQWFNKRQVIDRMLEKFQERKSGFKSVTDFRKIKQSLTSARKTGHAQEAANRVRRFVTDDSFTLDQVTVPSAAQTKKVADLTKQIDQLSDGLKAIEVEDYVGEESIWTGLERLLELIKLKLKSAGRRLP